MVKLTNMLGPALGLAGLAAVSASTAAPMAAAPQRPPAQLVLPARIAMIDTPLPITVRELEAGEQVTLTLSHVDEQGRRWESQAAYAGNEAGIVDVRRSEPIQGSYFGRSPLGLFWSMRLTDAEPDRTAYRRIGTHPLTYELTATFADGRVVADQLARRVMSPAVRAVKASFDGGDTRCFLPNGSGPFAAAVILGDDGHADDALVCQFANCGHASLALALPGMDAVVGTSAPLTTVQVRFDAAVAWLGQQEDVDLSRLLVVGLGRHGATALWLAATCPQVTAAISVGGGGSRIGFTQQHPAAAEMMVDGRSIRPLPIASHLELPHLCPAERLLLAFLRAPAEQREGATVPIEDTRGPVLLLSGASDRMMPAAHFAAIAYDRLAGHGIDDMADLDHEHRHVSYSGVGHLPALGALPGLPTTALAMPAAASDEPQDGGGNPRDTAEAVIDAWQRISHFLKRHEGTREVRRVDAAVAYD
jgi:Acyl-CoA thioester hydrolase/BAAT N-terminal region/BAAT / Acyl-CoA thioester hydrolase C terminal